MNYPDRTMSSLFISPAFQKAPERSW